MIGFVVLLGPSMNENRVAAFGYSGAHSIEAGRFNTRLICIRASKPQLLEPLYVDSPMQFVAFSSGMALGVCCEGLVLSTREISRQRHWMEVWSNGCSPSSTLLRFPDGNAIPFYVEHYINSYPSPSHLIRTSAHKIFVA